MSKRNPPILDPSDPISSDEWQDIQQSVGVSTQVKANKKKKSKSSDTNSYAKDNQKMIKKLKA